MKCARCGAKLKIDCMYCSVCGQEAQIVPDYSLLEDDFLKELLKEEKEPEKRQKKEPKTPPKKKKKKGPLIAAALGAVILLIILIIVLINHNQNSSYEYQMEQAESCIKDEEYEKAQNYLNRAVELEEDSVEAWLLLADVYIAQDETEDAIQVLEKVLELEKDSTEAYEKLIEVYAGRKEYDEIAKIAENVTDNSIMDLFSDYLVTAPVPDMEPGEYDDIISLEISSQQGTTTYYTLDGSDPQQGEEYTEPVPLEEGETTIRLISQNELGIYSEETKGVYNIKFQEPDKPEVTPRGGTFSQPQQITVRVPAGCTAYYTWDGSDPTENSERYTAALEMPEGNNIFSVILIDEHNMCSEVSKYNFVYTP